MGIEHINADAFPPNNSFNAIVIPEGVTSIGAYAFAGQMALTTVSLPSTIQYIGEGAFENCLILEKVVLPANLELMSNIFTSFSFNDFDLEMYSFNPKALKLEVFIPSTISDFDGLFPVSDAYGRSTDEFIWLVEKNSAAYQFALENRLPYRCIDDEADTSDALYGILVSTFKEDQVFVYETMDEQSFHTMKNQGTMISVAKQFTDWTMIHEGKEIGFVKNENLYHFDHSVDISYLTAIVKDDLPVYSLPSEEGYNGLEN